MQCTDLRCGGLGSTCISDMDTLCTGTPTTRQHIHCTCTMAYLDWYISYLCLCFLTLPPLRLLFPHLYIYMFICTQHLVEAPQSMELGAPHKQFNYSSTSSGYSRCISSWCWAGSNCRRCRKFPPSSKRCE